MTDPEMRSELKPVFLQCWPPWEFTDERVRKIWHLFSRYPVGAVIDATREHFFGSNRSYPLLNAIAERVAQTATRADIDEYDKLPARLQRAWAYKNVHKQQARELGSLGDIADALEATDAENTARHRRIRLADARADEVPMLCRAWWRERFRDLPDAEIIGRWEAWKLGDPMPEFNPEGPQQAEQEEIPF